jgi:copper transport protein
MLLGRPTVGDDNRTLTAEITEPVPAGTCVAQWRVSNTDGEPNGGGNITFVVQNDAAGVTTTADPGDTTSVAGTGTGTGTAGTAGTGGGTTPDDTADAGEDTASEDGDESDVIPLDQVEENQGPLWLGRMLSVLGIATMFGALVVIAAAWPEGVEYLVTVRFIRSAWIIALVGTVVYVAAAAAAIDGESFGAGFNPSLWPDLLDAGGPGRAALVRLAAVVLAGWVAIRPDRVLYQGSQLVALAIPAIGVATIGFSRTGGDAPILGIAMGILHALAMAVWVGGAILLARVVLVGPGEEDLVHAVRGFSRISNVAIIVTILTGLVQMIRLDGGDLFGSSHGRVVVLKAAIVAGMVFVAMSARQFVNQRLARADEMTAPMAGRLRRAFSFEAGLGLLVLLSSAWLLSLDPPNVDTSVSIDYAITRDLVDPDADLEVTVRLTEDRAVTSGLEVEVRAPETSLSNLEIIFTAPPNDSNIGTITQPVPLTGAGIAVRYEADGLPLTVPGEWTVQATGVTATGSAMTNEQTFVLLDPDGTTSTTAITVPPSVTVTIAPTDAPTTAG